MAFTVKSITIKSTMASNIKVAAWVLAGLTLSAIIQPQDAIAASLYVTSFNNNSVLRFDAETGDFIETFITNGAGGLNGPVGIAFGPQDNNLYVTSIFTNGRPPGQVIEYSGQTGGAIGPFTSLLPPLIFPQDLAFGPDNNLYVGNTGLDTIYRYDGSTGAFTGPLFAADPTGCDAPFGITSGSNNDLFFSCTFTNNVQRYDLATNRLQLLGTASSANAGPGGLSFGPDGGLYVANFIANTIDRYDVTTGLSTVFIDLVDSPVQPVFGPNGDLYVSSNPSQKVGSLVPGRVLRFDGQTGALKNDNFIPGLTGGLDGAGWIAFESDTAPVPEPSVVIGLVMVGLLFWRHRHQA